MASFEEALTLLLGNEGGYTTNRNDPGNWTGGVVGKGQLKGTKYGIAANSYPNLDIQNLTLAQAQDIYRQAYWNKIRGDELPPALAIIAFDAAVNNGVGRAVEWLQAAAGVTQDGVLGGITMAAIAAKPVEALLAEFMAQRINFMARLPTWASFGLGWARRLASIPLLALQATEQA